MDNDPDRTEMPADQSRRGFLRGAALGGAAALAAPLAAPVTALGQDAPASRQPPPLPNAQAERGYPEVLPPLAGVPGSDYMVDVLRSLGIDHIAFVPGDTFRGLHESVINYGMVTEPAMKFIPVMHEEVSVAICQGYAKIAGKPMACMVHSTVGLQHASMAIYNAWADRVPAVIIVGHQADADKRLGKVEWDHSVYDGPELVRDFIKYDDTPPTLAAFGDSAARAMQIAMTPPYGPVVLAVDVELQINPAPGGRAPPIPRMARLGVPQAEDAACAEIARQLIAAEHPVLYVDRLARTPQGVANLIELAEALQAPVVDGYSRFNFPWRHSLAQTSDADYLVSNADLILGLEVTDLYDSTRRAPPGARKITITSTGLFSKSNYQDLQRFTQVDMAIAADAEASVPAITEAVRRQLTPARRAALQQRGQQLARAHADALQRARDAAAIGWNDRPITTARLCAELHDKIRHDDWSLVNGTIFQSYWPQRLWTAEHHYQYMGDAGAYGLGYLPGAALGAAVANQQHGRLTVAIGGDGDLMFSPTFFWTAAHNHIPILYVVHNNRAYHQELMWLQAVAGRRQRGEDRCHIGTTIDHPNVDYSQLARSMGVHGEGPITDPDQLGAAFERALAVVRRGEPALVDVVAQGR
jgi:thiamine pyrophosphate-dependent acetolactate synthase large subunit-like protein